MKQEKRRIEKTGSMVKSSPTKLDLVWNIFDLDEAIEELEYLKKDKLLLDKLQLTTQQYGTGWILRQSSNGRGMRLHETSQPNAFKNIRDAIERYDLQQGT